MSTLNVEQTANRRVSRLRIVGALTAKDIGDALRNRQTISIVIMVALMLLFYRYLPLLEGNGDRQTVLLYDGGTSQFTTNLRVSPGLNLYEGYSSTAHMLEKLGSGDGTAELGLVLPADFDARLAAGETPLLQGYVAHWVSDQDAAQLIATAETELTLATGQPVRVELAPARAFETLSAYGPSFIAGVAVIFAALMIGVSLVPNLMLEEKKTRTLDVLLVSPATPGQIVAGKALAGLFYFAAVLVLLLVLFARLVIHWELAVAAFLCSALGFVALGLLIGIWVNTRQQLQLVVFIGAQPLLIPIFLSIMSDILPGWLVTLFSWLPTVAMLNLFRAACVPAPTLSEVGQPLALSVGTMALLLALVVVAVRRQDR